MICMMLCNQIYKDLHLLKALFREPERYNFMMLYPRSFSIAIDYQLQNQEIFPPGQCKYEN